MTNAEFLKTRGYDLEEIERAMKEKFNLTDMTVDIGNLSPTVDTEFIELFDVWRSFRWNMDYTTKSGVKKDYQLWFEFSAKDDEFSEFYVHDNEKSHSSYDIHWYAAGKEWKCEYDSESGLVQEDLVTLGEISDRMGPYLEHLIRSTKKPVSQTQE